MTSISVPVADSVRPVYEETQTFTNRDAWVSPVPVVELALPVYNEAHVLEKSVTALVEALEERFCYPLKIIIVDNASTDGTDQVGKELAARFENVEFRRLETKGRGYALAAVWNNSRADIVSYMDIDLSTDLSHYLPMIKSVVNGADVAIGVRLHPEAKVTRCLKRSILSRGYAFLFRTILDSKPGTLNVALRP